MITNFSLIWSQCLLPRNNHGLLYTGGHGTTKLVPSVFYFGTQVKSIKHVEITHWVRGWGIINGTFWDTGSTFSLAIFDTFSSISVLLLLFQWRRNTNTVHLKRYGMKHKNLVKYGVEISSRSNRQKKTTKCLKRVKEGG